MARYRLGHDLDDDPELYAGHVLDEVPLVFKDGEAIVEDQETARALARRHTHIHVIGAVQDADNGVAAPFDPGALTVAELESRLSDGAHSPTELEALCDAEADGDDRETALDAINAALAEA